MTDERLFTIDPAMVREETTLAPGNGGLVQVHVIPYTITSGPGRGHSGEIRVSPADFQPDTVDALIRDKISQLEGIASLGGPGA